MSTIVRRLRDGRCWRYAGVYGLGMVAVEVLLIAVFGLRIPRDTARIAPLLFLLVPMPAALLCGFRRPASLLAVIFLSVAFTIALSVTVGAASGLLSPLIVRPLAGFTAASLVAPKA